jgi:hypothetical protein
MSLSGIQTAPLQVEKSACLNPTITNAVAPYPGPFGAVPDSRGPTFAIIQRDHRAFSDKCAALRRARLGIIQAASYRRPITCRPSPMTA